MTQHSEVNVSEVNVSEVEASEPEVSEVAAGEREVSEVVPSELEVSEPGASEREVSEPEVGELGVSVSRSGGACMSHASQVRRPDRPDSAAPPMPDGDDAVPDTAGDGRAGAARSASAHVASTAGTPAEQVTLRSATELADALPYLLGYRPEDSIVLVTVHDRHGHGSFGGRARLGIPERAEDWPTVARQLARCLVSGCERRGARPEGMVAFVCREPARGETGHQVMEALRPLAQLLRTECGSLDIPVLEALCISDGRFWSYCCPGPQCCSEDGTPMGLPGSSVLSAAMTYAGFQVRGTLKEFRARLTPWETAAALDQQVALDAAGMALAPMILDDAHRAEVAADTLDLARRLIGRLACAPRAHGALEADQQDDGLLAHDEAAALIFGLQDRTTRDRFAEWMEGEVCGPALRLWRALARRCVGPYGEYAAAPLTLAGWVAWSTGDELEAREALAMALGANPDYTLARLLHQACNEGVAPEAVRRCLRRESAGRSAVGRSAVDRLDVERSDVDLPDAGRFDAELPDAGWTDGARSHGERSDVDSSAVDWSAADWSALVRPTGDGLRGAREVSAAVVGEEPGAAAVEKTLGDEEASGDEETPGDEEASGDQEAPGDEEAALVEQVPVVEHAPGDQQAAPDGGRVPRTTGALARVLGRGSGRTRPSGSRGEARRGPRSTRPGSGRAAAGGPAASRPPRHRRTTGRG